MPNLRVLADNAIDSTSSLTASTSSGTLVASNLKDNRKGRVHRSTGVTLQYVAQWSVAKTINMVALAFTNLTPTATMQIRGYANTTDTIGVSATVFSISAGVCTAAPNAARQDGRGALLGVNQFSFFGFSHAVRWFTGGSVKMLAIDIVDTVNPSGYIEVSRLVAGSYWEPSFNPDYNASITFPDTTKNERSEAGDLISDTGLRTRRLSMNLSMMPTADRQKFSDILKVNGMSVPVFVSLFPEDADTDREQTYMLYGKLAKESSVNLPTYNRYSFPLELEEL